MFPIYNFYTLSVGFKNCNNDAFKWRGSSNCHIELDVASNRRWRMYCCTFVCYYGQEIKFAAELKAVICNSLMS